MTSAVASSSLALDYPDSTDPVGQPDVQTLDYIDGADRHAAIQGATITPDTSFSIPTMTILDADIAPTFYDSFYERLHYLPASYDFGPVVSTITTTLTVWNAFRSDRSMTASSLVNEGGVTMTGPEAPYTFQALDIIEYVVGVSDGGPVNINYEATWTVGGIDYAVPLTGQRVVGVIWEPDWNVPIEEDFEFLTDIIYAFDGSEQRRAIRVDPRRTYRYEALLYAGSLRDYQNTILGWQNRAFALPRWHESRVTTQALALNDTELYFDTTGLGLQSTALVIVYNAYDDFYLASVSAVAADHVTLSTASSVAYPEGVKVMPVMVGRMSQRVQGRRITDDVARVSMEFLEAPATTIDVLPTGGSAEQTYGSDEVLIRQPNWAEDIAFSNESRYQVFDSRTGANGYLARDAYGKMGRVYRYLLNGADDVAYFKGLIERLRGRAKTVLVPTWNQDLELTLGATAGTGQLRCRTDNYIRFAKDNLMQNKLATITHAGVVEVYDITDANTFDDDEMLVDISPVLATGITADSHKLSFVHRCRLSVDEVTFQYLSANVAIVELPFQSVTA